MRLSDFFRPPNIGLIPRLTLRKISRMSLSLGPYTAGGRRITSGILSRNERQACSASSFDCPYDVMGRQGASSVRGVPSGLGPTAVRLLTKQNLLRLEAVTAAWSR